MGRGGVSAAEVHRCRLQLPPVQPPTIGGSSDSDDDAYFELEFDLTAQMHSRGLNLRLLGEVLRHIPVPSQSHDSLSAAAAMALGITSDRRVLLSVRQLLLREMTISRPQSAVTASVSMDVSIVHVG